MIKCCTYKALELGIWVVDLETPKLFEGGGRWVEKLFYHIIISVGNPLKQFQDLASTYLAYTVESMRT